MTKPHILRLVPAAARPLANLSRAEKLHNAIGWLRQRGRYVLDQGSTAPKWGVAGEPKRVAQRLTYRSAPTLIERFAETISTLWSGQ